MSMDQLRYEELVRLVEERAEVKAENGLDKVIKHIPDIDVRGDFDPRVLENMKKQAEAMPKQQQKPEPEPSPSSEAQFPIEAIRASMGWPNKDVTRTAVSTSHQTITGENGDIPLRIYRPKQEGELPAVVFIHGGGFIGGSVDTVENPCKALAEKASAVVVSVDYRLAPEHPFPAGLKDCFDTIKWVYTNAEQLGVNRQQIAVSGDSAGGNLATVCALLDRNLGTMMIKFQALIYPVVNLGQIETEDYQWSLDQYVIEHHHDLIRASVLALKGGDMIQKLYIQNKAELADPHVSPLLADDLTGMPETLIVTAEYDFLRLECEAYARKLLRSGVRTQYIQYCGMDHAFIDKLGEYPQAEDCMSEIAKAMKQAFLHQS